MRFAPAILLTAILSTCRCSAPTNSTKTCVYNNFLPKASGSDNFPGGSRYEDKFDDDYERGPELENVTVAGVGTVQVERCALRSQVCYAFWSEGPGEGEAVIHNRGCWELSDRRSKCGDTECKSKRWSSPWKRDTRFCCCKSDLCNLSPFATPLPTETASPVLDTPSGTPSVNDNAIKFGSVAIIVGASFTGITIIIFFIFKYMTRRHKMNADVDNERGHTENGGPGFSCSTTCVDNLKLHDNIGSGRHVKVWRGSLGGIPVAVKALPSTQTTLWAHERDLYCLPHMKHPNLLQYFGCDTRPTLEGPPEHLLVLQLAPLGSLRNFLTENTLEWEAYTNMSLGIASALAYLHTGFEKDGLCKPSVVHRDVNSSNIVVNADLTCCLADLGLAMPLPDEKSNVSHTQYRIQEAGTLRYLAPEALEGSLDLRRCGASLRAIDVYALALVLWELLSRCSVLHRAPGPPPYAPPFQAEIGDQPTLERMQVIVAKRKARPLFSPRLLPLRATRLARDTCEDCWDHDAEARLTAVCVVERLNELRNMKPAPSPTINSNDLRPSPQNQDSNWQSPGSGEDKNSNVNSSATGNISNLIDFQANVRNKLPLQPHQGRNPCLERNLASVGEDEQLIDKSLKDMSAGLTPNGYGTNFIGNEQQQPPPVEQNYRNIAQDFSRLEEQNIHSSRNLNRSYSNQNSSSVPVDYDDFYGIPDDQSLNEFRHLMRPVTPIGYVQNDVSSDMNGVLISSTDNNPYGYPAKINNHAQESNRSRWGAGTLKKFLDKKIFKKKNALTNPVPLETEVNFVLSNGKPINNSHLNSNPGKFKTSLIVNDTKSKINRDNYIHIQNDGFADRPSSLPGLDSVVSNGTEFTDCSSDDSQRSKLVVVNGNASHKVVNQLDNNTCLLSPPNRTITKTDRNGPESLIGDFQSFNGSNQPSNPNPSNPVFAVIVPKATYNPTNKSVIEDVQKVCVPQQKSFDATTKTEDKLVKSDNCDSDGFEQKHQYESKRFSCDGKILTSLIDGSSEVYQFNKGLRNAPNQRQNRNSYSGEFDHFCKYNNESNFEDSNVDYSSNSEDEHMLLLSENGGSKITMRQRYDVRPSQDGKPNRRSQPSSSSLSVQDIGISKMATEGFTSMCNKYGSQNKYENFENEHTDHKSETAHKNHMPYAKDVTFVRNSKLSLPIISPENGMCIDSDAAMEDLVDGNVCRDKGEIGSNNDDNDSSLQDDSSKKSLNSFRPLSIKQNLSRQHSLELVNELFSSSADLTRLKDPASRIKTPGDVPPSVRKMRGSIGSSRIRRTGSAKESSKTSANRLSLYDDRMMFGNSL